MPYKLSAMKNGYMQRIGIYETVEEATLKRDAINKKNKWAKAKVVYVPEA